MALSTQVMHPAPYTIPPPRMHRPAYNPHFGAPNTTPSAFFQSRMLPPSLGTIHATTNISPVSHHAHLPGATATNPPHQRNHSTSSASSAQASSPVITEETLSDHFKSPFYSPLHSMNGTVSSPTSCMQPAPLVTAPATYPQSTMLTGSMSMYHTPPDYVAMNGSLPTPGTACLPPLPLWNPYPSLPMGSIPKLSYDTPRYKLTPERAIPLMKWFEDHKDHPYPTRHEKILLCQATQLTFTQVSTWFANARRRMKKANAEEEKGGSSDESSQNEAESPTPSNHTCNGYSNEDGEDDTCMLSHRKQSRRS